MGPFTLLSIKRQLQLRIVIVTVITQAVMLLPVGREVFQFSLTRNENLLTAVLTRSINNLFRERCKLNSLHMFNRHCVECIVHHT